MSFRVILRRYGREVTRAELADVRATPLWTSNDTRSRGRDDLPIHVDPTQT